MVFDEMFRLKAIVDKVTAADGELLLEDTEWAEQNRRVLNHGFDAYHEAMLASVRGFKDVGKVQIEEGKSTKS